jgi:predicted ATPase
MAEVDAPSSAVSTLTGPGGSGKRGGITIAADLVEEYPDGWVVDWPPPPTPRSYPGSCPRACVREQPGQALVDTLIDYIAERSCPLLDNCEHLLGACATLAGRLLQASRSRSWPRAGDRVPGGNSVVPSLASRCDPRATTDTIGRRRRFTCS